VLDGGQTLVDRVALWKLLVDVDVDHATRECVVLEATTSVRRLHCLLQHRANTMVKLFSTDMYIDGGQLDLES
jgi:hypothetical protein